MIQTGRVLRRILILTGKKYPTLADYSRRLITRQKTTEIENKTTSVTGLVTSAAFNTKATKIEIKYLMLLICLTKLL